MSKKQGIASMNSHQIQARLAELDTTEAELLGIDYDAELSAALLSGADVDALEERQLESERLARRLKVERQALVGALPEALKQEAVPALESLTKDHDKLANEAKQNSQRIVELGRELAERLDQWLKYREDSDGLTQEGFVLSQRVGLPAPKLGSFVDQGLSDVLLDIGRAKRKIGRAAEHARDMGSNTQACELS